MHYKLFEQLKRVLEKDERLVAEGELLRNRIVELARKNDPFLLKHLLADKQVKGAFFTDVDGVQVFDSERFVRFVNNKDFLPDSYTAFKNKIGLAEGDEFVSEKKDVVLNWPYKDCVLEGGQTKEDAKRDEVFWNETLAPDQIHRLLDPKVFTNWKRIDAKGEHKLPLLAGEGRGEVAIDWDKQNLIIKGNNLLALHSLKPRFAGKVKLIYIDPPYNTEGPEDYFKYNDNFNHSTWLVFLRNRLEIAKDFLTEDGAIYVQLDYNEVHYCKILMDEIFGRDNFQREIVWRIGWVSGYKSADKNWIRNHDTILFYSKNKNNLRFIKKHIPYPKDYVRRDGSKPEGAGYPYEDTWNANELDPLNSIAIVSFSKEKVGYFKGQKNEALIQRIIEAHTEKGDIVLDFFSGSGTTASVSHKLGRQWITVEQIDEQIGKQIDRLKKVIAGDQTGISKEVKWKGGGDFVYAELMPLNQTYKEKVESAKTEKELRKVWDEIQEKGFLSYKIDIKKFDVSAKDFSSLSLTDQKRFILESLDYNQLYVNYSEMEDKDYGVSGEDKKLNNDFYG